MNLEKNFERSQEIYKTLSSKSALQDRTNLSLKEYFKKYYWFLPKEIIENIEKINEEFEEYNNNSRENLIDFQELPFRIV